MSGTRTHDLKSNLAGGVSLKSGTTLSGTTPANGLAVGVKTAQSPAYAECAVAAAVNSPTSFTVTFKMQESSDGSTSWGDVANQDTVVLSSDSTRGVVRARHTKPYVRVVATPAFTGGSSPTIDCCANVLHQKRNT